MTGTDWRDADPALMRRLYAAETVRWDAALHWDTRTTWTQVEAARLSGTLHGVLVDAGLADPAWAFFVMHGDEAQVGALVARSGAATEALVDAVLGSVHGRAASSVMVFVPDTAPGLERALGARNFAVDRYLYHVRALTDADAVASMGRMLQRGDAESLATLFRRSYAEPGGARPFARGGSDVAWAEYVTQLLDTTACGVPLAAASPVWPVGPGGRRIAGAVLSTVIGPSSVHLAQVVVDPVARGAGMGRRLVRAALGGARGLGFDRATLLVSERNTPALALYRSLGFEPTASFCSATRVQPRRLTSVALDAGGASTFL